MRQEYAKTECSNPGRTKGTQRKKPSASSRRMVARPEAKASETWEGEMKGIKVFSDGCFCQFGEERTEMRAGVGS